MQKDLSGSMQWPRWPLLSSPGLETEQEVFSQGPLESPWRYLTFHC